MRNSEILNKAADYIEVNGWWSGGGGGTDGPKPTCAGNAIYYVTGRDERLWPRAQAALVLHLTGAPGYLGQVWSWNDNPRRTACEVIEALRATALIEAAKENTDTRQQVSA